MGSTAASTSTATQAETGWRKARRIALGLAVLTILAVVDYVVLRALDVSYFRWYLTNGSLISLFLAALAAGIDLNREPRLVASDPGIFLASWMTVPAMVSLDFAGILRDRSRPIDGMLTGLFATLLIAIWICYLVVVAPLQYVVTLVAGAPARLALGSSSRAWVERTGDHVAITSGPSELMPEGAESIGLTGRPVTATSAFGAVLLFAVSLFF